LNGNFGAKGRGSIGDKDFDSSKKVKKSPSPSINDFVLNTNVPTPIKAAGKTHHPRSQSENLTVKKQEPPMDFEEGTRSPKDNEKKEGWGM